jgi:hypothetical protein
MIGKLETGAEDFTVRKHTIFGTSGEISLMYILFVF